MLQLFQYKHYAFKKAFNNNKTILNTLVLLIIHQFLIYELPIKYNLKVAKMNKSSKITVTLFLSLLFTISSSVNAQPVVNNWKNSFDNIWKSNDGLCWRDSNWTHQTASQECDGASCKYIADTKFPFDNYDIQIEAKFLLDNLLQKIKKIEIQNIISIGHTDSIGKDNYNNKLSVLRANSVKQYLSNHGNLSSDLIVVEGRGSKEPQTSNETPDGRARNRRVEVEILGINR